MLGFRPLVLFFSSWSAFFYGWEMVVVCRLFCSLIFSFWANLLLLVVFFRVEFGVDTAFGCLFSSLAFCYLCVSPGQLLLFLSSLA